ncbi:hypothetical protein PhCBS80983_g01515 [Powellomyces hirtus]|uniref:Uncharacterized protein n=1 Tax=Powellomyces hirtus TaxID=109895 RepID=A0A507EBW2_9FUNG|nr:hypothetical protein PhCBS80983_g01515 [Powellomyces hirtus]
MLPAERRKEELEKKRAKLAELRRAKEVRKNALDAQKRDPVGSDAYAERKDLDDLVTSLVGDRPVSRNRSRDELGSSVSTPSILDPQTLRDAIQSSVPDASRSTESVETGREKQQPTLVSADFVFLDMAPKEKVMYTKEIQTETVDLGFNSMADGETWDTRRPPKQEVDVIQPEQASPVDIAAPETPPPEPLTEDEKKSIVSSERFLDFFDYSSKLVERALNETTYDFMKDYTVDDDRVIDESAGKNIQQVCCFSDERWTRNRAVTDCSWSQKHPELLLASYSKNQATVTEADGSVLIWNLHLRERPEYIFQSQSDVTVATFSDFHPNFVIGGTYSGQIVIWDMRAKSRPVLQSPLSAAGHTHPVYSMSIIGTQNAHNLLSASTDGLEALDLVHPSNVKTDGVSITTMAFPYNETTTFWVGTEEGSIHQANRYDRAGSKAGINPLDAYKGHHGMVTSLDFHPLSGPADFSDLFLTSSADWTVKLWRAKSASKASMASEPIMPLYSFEEADDYVYDVKWSPSHPSLFGCVDGSGRFDLYDLNREIEVPTVSMSTGTGKALNKLAWDKEGRRTATGSSDGQLYVYDLGEISQPHSDEWNMFQRTLAELEAR